MEKADKPELPFHNDFYYPFEYTLENMEREFLSALGKAEYQDFDKKRIFKALKHAKHLHDGEFRKELDRFGNPIPYVIHSIEVALSVMKDGSSPNNVIAALFHDVRENIGWMKELENGEVARVFGSRVVEVLTRLLSKYRSEVFGFSGKTYSGTIKLLAKIIIKIVPNIERVRKLDNEEYFKKLAEEVEAILIKIKDRKKNIKSDGRRLEYFFERNDFVGTLNLIRCIEDQIEETRDFVIPITANNYKSLGRKLEELVVKLETRIQVVKTFIAEQIGPA